MGIVRIYCLNIQSDVCEIDLRCSNAVELEYEESRVCTEIQGLLLHWWRRILVTGASAVATRIFQYSTLLVIEHGKVMEQVKMGSIGAEKLD